MSFLKNKRLFLILSIFLFIIFAFLLTYLFEGDNGISNVQVTNITSTSVTVVWETEKPTNGELLVSKEDSWKFLEPVFTNKQTAFDDRDLLTTEDGTLTYNSENIEKRTVHHVTIRDLEPSTSYYFRIKGNLKAFKSDINTFATSDLTDEIVQPDTAYGSINDYQEEGSVAEGVDGIVVAYLASTNGTRLSPFISSTLSNGSYNLDLNTWKRLASFDASNLVVMARTEEGNGEQMFTLANGYKPLGDLLINFAYTPDPKSIIPLDTTATDVKVIDTSEFPYGDVSVADIGPCSVSCSGGATFSDANPSTFSSCNHWAGEACATVGQTPGNVSGGGGSNPTNNNNSNNNNNQSAPPVNSSNNSNSNKWTCAQNFGNSCIDTNGTSRCLSTYLEPCGSGLWRRIECGAGGEFYDRHQCIFDSSGNIKATVEEANNAKTCPLGSFDPDGDGVCTVGDDNQSTVNATNGGHNQTIHGESIDEANNKVSAENPSAGRGGGGSNNSAGSGSNNSGQGGGGVTSILNSCNDISSATERQQCEDALELLTINIAGGSEATSLAESQAAAQSICSTQGGVYFSNKSNNVTDIGCTFPGPMTVVLFSCSNATGCTANPNYQSDIQEAQQDLQVPLNPNANCPVLNNSNSCSTGTIRVNEATFNNDTGLCTYQFTFHEGDAEGGNPVGQPLSVYGYEASSRVPEAIPTCTSLGISPSSEASNNLCPTNLSVSCQIGPDDSLVVNNTNTQNIPVGGFCSYTVSYIPPTGQPIIRGINVPIGNFDSMNNHLRNTYTCPDSNSNQGEQSVSNNPVQQCYQSYSCPAPYNSCSDAAVTGVQTTKGNLGSDGIFSCKFRIVDVDNRPFSETYHNYNIVNCSSGSAVASGIGIDWGQVCPNIQGSYTSKFFKRVSAQSNIPTPSVIDPAELESGSYQIDITGFETADVEVYTEKIKIQYYFDKNGDGKKQDGEEYIDPKVYTVSVSKTSEISRYNINKGWNLISLNFNNPNINTASKLIKEFWKQSINVVQISKYDSGKWVHFVARLNNSGEFTSYGSDFTLVPGAAYFVRALDGGKGILTGNLFTSSAPISMKTGWNLIGVQAPGKDYTAGSFLTMCTAQGAGCTNISKFENGKYESTVKESGTLFGNDFKLTNKNGYFVFNNGAAKTFKP